VPAALGLGQPLYDWIIVDEAQDMSAAQLMVARGALKDGGHMVIVGDDRQAIYGFRGADTGCIDRLKVELDAEEMGLNTTYRCPTSVVDVARKLVGDFCAADGAPEGQVISGTRADVLEKARPGDAILSRTNAPLVPLCLAFIRKDIPAKIEGRDIGKMLIERAKSKSLKSETVEEFIEKLARWSDKAVKRVLSSGKDVETKLQGIEDVKETLEAIAENCGSMEDFYARCDSLFADVDQNGTKQFVILSTVHKAKGLEWDRVFLLRGTLYCNGARRDDPEEANIHYVAVTRSKSALMMVGSGDADADD
jgi:superfamily I DNA/RNA helicase